MLEQIKVALQEYKDTYVGASKIWKNARKDLHDNYRGNLFTVKLNEAKDLYENTLQTARTDCLATCILAIDDIREQAMKIISVPVSPDFTVTLEAFRNIKNPSNAELEAIFGTFKNNYVAYRAICDALGGVDKGYIMVTYDEIMEYCDELEGTLHNCFYNYEPSGDEYYRIQNGKGIDLYDLLFTTFTKGEFASAYDAMKEIQKAGHIKSTSPLGDMN